MAEHQSFFKSDEPNPPWPKARAERLETDGYQCQAFRFGITTRCEHWPTGVEVHHRLPRGRGGTNHQPNLITLCPGHHRWAESYRDDAVECGLLFRSGNHPAEAIERGWSLRRT